MSQEIKAIRAEGHSRSNTGATVRRSILVFICLGLIAFILIH